MSDFYNYGKISLTTTAIEHRENWTHAFSKINSRKEIRKIKLPTQNEPIYISYEVIPFGKAWT